MEARKKGANGGKVESRDGKKGEKGKRAEKRKEKK